MIDFELDRAGARLNSFLPGSEISYPLFHDQVLPYACLHSDINAAYCVEFIYRLLRNNSVK
jgi:formate-dependent nitrite reductase membrane component NrfD